MEDYTTSAGLSKRCPRCKTVKPLTSEFFSRDRTAKQGFSHRCKTCDKKRYQLWIRSLPTQVDPETKRQCVQCKCEFPATPEFFAINRRSKDGLQTTCLNCKRKNGVEQSTAVYQERKRNGICTLCGKRPPRDESLACNSCRQRRMRARREKASIGLCHFCYVRPPLPDRTYCQPCKDRQRRNVKQAKTRAAALGLCWCCKARKTGSVLKKCEVCRAQSRRRAERHKQHVFERYGNYCACCGLTDARFLSVDHVNNDGAHQRRTRHGTGEQFYRYILKLGCPNEYQLLCFNCNFAKRMFAGVCPHEIDKKCQI